MCGQEGQLVPKGGLLQRRRREQVLEVGQEGHIGRFVLQCFRRVPFQDVLEGAKVGLPVLDRLRVHADACSWSVEPVHDASVEADGRGERAHGHVMAPSRMKEPQRSLKVSQVTRAFLFGEKLMSLRG